MAATTQPKAALAIIDLQNDFCPPNGALAVEGGRDIAKMINHLLTLPFALKLATRDFHPKDHISFASQHAGKKPFTDSHTITSPENAEEKQTTTLWPDHCVQGTAGCELIEELDTKKLDMVLDKGQGRHVESYSAFGPPFRKPMVAMSGLEGTLKKAGITHVFVCGLAWDFCVKFSAIDAADFGFMTYVLEDATRGIERGEGARKRTRDELTSHGVRCISSDSKEMLDLLKDA